MNGSDEIDFAIVGAGPGGVIALHFTIDAGLRTLLLEKQDAIGGLWAQPWRSEYLSLTTDFPNEQPLPMPGKGGFGL
jgi:cation diffusion facilitator CzcD-associated flavoprotein CzcO